MSAIRYPILCPACQRYTGLQRTFEQTTVEATCPHCHAGFTTVIKQVHTKTGRCRVFQGALLSVREIDAAGTLLLREFEFPYNLDLRPGHVVVYYFRGPVLEVVHNLTVKDGYNRRSGPRVSIAACASGADARHVNDSGTSLAGARVASVASDWDTQ